LVETGESISGSPEALLCLDHGAIRKLRAASPRQIRQNQSSLTPLRLPMPVHLVLLFGISDFWRAGGSERRSGKSVLRYLVLTRRN